MILTFMMIAAISGWPGDDDKPPLPPAAARSVDFLKDVRPIFQAHCVKCHGAGKAQSGFRLDNKAAALRGGDGFAPDIVPGQSADSPLIRIVSGLEDDLIMPPKGEGKRLSADQIGVLRAWIDQGAPWPDESSPMTNASDPKTRHWSFQPLKRPEPPSNPSKNPIDRFLLAQLAKNGLRPSPEADRAALIRRVTFDLHGLPPTPEDVQAYVADAHPDAWERLVERLLTSRRYGERWARHWLDVVRFAESNGFETNQPRPNAWPYRDYVIQAFNEDKPYNQFLREQIAGDALGIDEATGFLVAGPWDQVKSPDPVLTSQQRADELHDMISVTGSAFLGLTIGCARCHDHKFDPIPQTDYYAIKAIFAGVQHGERAIKPPDQVLRDRERANLLQRLRELDQNLAKYEPIASLASFSIIATDDPNRTDSLLATNGRAYLQTGTERGQTDDPGSIGLTPNLGRGYLYWKANAKQPVFAWKPAVAGRYRIWPSWGCGFETHASDAVYLIDQDGDLATTQDRIQIAKVDQRKFADNTGNMPSQPLWSGFYDAGVHELRPESRILLAGGDRADFVTADVLLIQKESASKALTQPQLRNPVQAGKNIDRFAPIKAKYLRFTIQETNQSEPCIDELEVFTVEPAPRDIALARWGTKVKASSSLPGYEIHKLEHIHDGIYGNPKSWVSNEPGKGQVEFEFAETVLIDRVIWSRDRSEPPQFQDRVATKYQIEIAEKLGEWKLVGNSDDRMAMGTKLNGGSLTALNADSQDSLKPESLRDWQTQRGQISKRIKELEASASVYAGRMTTPEETHRLYRGDPMLKRELMAPGVLSQLAIVTKPNLSINSNDQERRLALAQWVTDPHNPLTARVMVNRIWQYHFGAGIVATPSDFGINGALPSHPELLDWLASELIAKGWRIKDIHRLILHSQAYRQTTLANAEGMNKDINNRLLWRFSPHRLEAEAVRDSILAISGVLNLDAKATRGPGFDLFEPNTNYVKVYNSKKTFGPEEFRRMVFQSKPRMQLDNIFGSFDCPDGGQIAPKRTQSTTPLQTLSLLNSEFLNQQAEFLAKRLKTEVGSQPQAQVKRGFQLAFQREPDPTEQAAATHLIQEHGLTSFARALFNANEFLSIH